MIVYYFNESYIYILYRLRRRTTLIINVVTFFYYKKNHRLLVKIVLWMNNLLPCLRPTPHSTHILTFQVYLLCSTFPFWGVPSVNFIITYKRLYERFSQPNPFDAPETKRLTLPFKPFSTQ